jgi:hypothetical protein
VIPLSTANNSIASIGRSVGPPVFALLLAALGLAGCSGQGLTGSRPLSDSLLVEVLVDLHLSQAREQSYPGEFSVTADSVLAAHGVTRKMLDHSLDLIEAEGQRFSELYARVIERLAVINAEYSTWQEMVDRYERERTQGEDAAR